MLKQISRESTYENRESQCFFHRALEHIPLQPCAVPLDNRDEEEKAKIESRDLSRTKRRCALEELVATEKTYINDLEGVVGGYMERIRNGAVTLPKDLKRGKINFVFGNIEDIYKFHRDQFLGRLEKCLEEPEQLGSAFIR